MFLACETLSLSGFCCSLAFLWLCVLWKLSLCGCCGFQNRTLLSVWCRNPEALCLNLFPTAAHKDRPIQVQATEKKLLGTPPRDWGPVTPALGIQSLFSSSSPIIYQVVFSSSRYLLSISPVVATFIFYLFIWLCQVCLSDGIKFLTKDRTWAPCIGHGFLTTGLLEKSILNRL